jgi:hypothetical protein
MHILMHKIFILNLQNILNLVYKFSLLTYFHAVFYVQYSMFCMFSLFFEAYNIFYSRPSFIAATPDFTVYTVHVCTCKPKLHNIFNIYRRNPFGI